MCLFIVIKVPFNCSKHNITVKNNVNNTFAKKAISKGADGLVAVAAAWLALAGVLAFEAYELIRSIT